MRALLWRLRRSYKYFKIEILISAIRRRSCVQLRACSRCILLISIARSLHRLHSSCCGARCSFQCHSRRYSGACCSGRLWTHFLRRRRLFFSPATVGSVLETRSSARETVSHLSTQLFILSLCICYIA